MADTLHTDTAFIMKRRYSDAKSAKIATREHPSLFELTKEQGMDGSDFRYAVQTGNPQSISTSFTSAQDAAGTNSGLKGEQFAAEPVLKYGILKLDGPSMLRAQGNKGSFFDFVTRHADGMLEEMGARLGFDLFQDANGILGRRSSISGNTITLTGARTADRFKRGMAIGASSSADGSSARVGSSYVTKVSRKANTVTLNDASAIASFSDNDYLFIPGSAAGVNMQGMALCTPLASPGSSDSFRGVNRSNDEEALAGSRIDNTAIYPEEVLQDLAVDIQCIFKSVTRGTMHPTKFQDVVKRLGAKVEYHSPGKDADIGFESFMIHAAGKAMRIVSDPDCPVDRTRCWNPRSHLIRYLGPELIYWIRTSGGDQSQWSTSTDGIEMRSRFYGNYLQPDPSEHGVGSVA